SYYGSRSQRTTRSLTSWQEEAPPSRRSLRPPNERSVRISRTTLYRTVAGTTPGREFTDEVPTKVIQPGQSEVKPKPLVGIPSPKPVAPPLRLKARSRRVIQRSYRSNSPAPS